MRLVEDIIVASAGAAQRPLATSYQGEAVDLTPPYRRERMADLVLEHTGRRAYGIELNDLFEEHVEPTLRQPTFVVDYPIEISPLAQRCDYDPRFVERFELIILGREYANAFTELTDPVDQRQRCAAQGRGRARRRDPGARPPVARAPARGGDDQGGSEPAVERVRADARRIVEGPPEGDGGARSRRPGAGGGSEAPAGRPALEGSEHLR